MSWNQKHEVDIVCVDGSGHDSVCLNGAEKLGTCVRRR